MTITTAPLRPAAPARKRVDLTEHRQLLADLATVEEQEKQIQALKAELRAKLKEIIGEGGEGVLDGRPIYAYVATDGFAAAKLKKDWPDFYNHYCKTQMQTVLDVDRLARELPDLWESYRVRSLMPVGGRRVFVAEEAA
jgi:hypothetical protein